MNNEMNVNPNVLRSLFEMKHSKTAKTYDSSIYSNKGMVDLYKKWLFLIKKLETSDCVRFAFKKVTTNEIRFVNATTKNLKDPKYAQSGWNFPYVCFYDLDAKGYRCMRIETLI